MNNIGKVNTGVVIAVDFDGTIAEHRFPRIGDEVPGALMWLKRFQSAGAKLILWTMRSDDRPHGEADVLRQAVEWCRFRGLEFWGVNSNPQQFHWTGSPKAYAHLYIDDVAACCPLRPSATPGARPMVNWDVVGPHVEQMLSMAR